MPGLVLFIFILSPLSTVAECSIANLAALPAAVAPLPPPVEAIVGPPPPLLVVLSFVFSMSASRSMMRSPIPMSHSLSSYSKLDSALAAVLGSATFARWPSNGLSLIGAAMGCRLLRGARARTPPSPPPSYPLRKQNKKLRLAAIYATALRQLIN